MRARSFALFPPKGLRNFTDVAWKRRALAHEQALEGKVGELFLPARDATGETGPQLQGLRAAKFEHDSQVTFTTSWGKVMQGRATAIPANPVLSDGNEGGGGDDDDEVPEAVVVDDDEA